MVSKRDRPGDYVLITGGSKGIGFALAEEFAKHGHNLILVARHERNLKSAQEKLVRDFGVDVIILSKDLSLPDSAANLYSEIMKKGLPVGILINNAGFGLLGEFSKNDVEIERRMMQLNMVALVELTKLYLKPMLVRKHGRILNVASTAGMLPGPLMAVYYASKAFVISFSEALSEELNGTGVTVTTLCPGPTRTNFAHEARMKESRVMKLAGMKAEDVAVAGYRGVMAGKRTVIPGIQNKATAFFTRIVPKSILLKAVKRVNRDR